MKLFLENLMKKMTSKGLALFALAVAVFVFIVGILSISNGGSSSVGTFINALISTFLFCLLANFLFKKDKQKTLIVTVLLIATYVLNYLGNCIQNFAYINGSSGIGLVITILDAIGYLAFFVGAAFMLIPHLFAKMNKETLNLVIEISLFLAAILFLVVGILTLTTGGSGLALAVSFLANLALAMKAIFFAFEAYQMN